MWWTHFDYSILRSCIINTKFSEQWCRVKAPSARRAHGPFTVHIHMVKGYIFAMVTVTRLLL